MHRNLLLALTITMVSAGSASAQIVPGKLGHNSGTGNAAIESATVKDKQAVPAVEKKSQESAPDKEVSVLTKAPVPEIAAAAANPEPVAAWSDHKVQKHEISGADQFADTVIVFNEEMFQSPPGTANAGAAPKTANVAPSAMVEEKNAASTSVPGVNTSGTVRVEGLQNAECLFNVLANGFIALGIAWAGPSLMTAFIRLGASEQGALKHVIHVLLGMIGLVAMPAVINWLVASGRDAGIFHGM
ncbi:MAG: hypothetical protein K2W95_27285 [Candidatus Obscuribacterales bacterium]|nr:hypothetical protein [Candidatus Obscuribacterales bacterium]